jgi:hypothetical protein
VEITANQMQERDRKTHPLPREDSEQEGWPELSIEPLVDLLARLVRERPWQPSAGNALADAHTIDDWACEEPIELITWIQTIEKCSQAIQALIRFKVGHRPRTMEDQSSEL